MGFLETPAAVRSSRRSDGGFTIIEVTVALSLMMLVMASFAYVMTQSLAQVSLAKQRQTANGLLDQTMEQVRALKYSAVQAGLDTIDLTNNPDPTNVTSAGGVYTFTPNGETIVTATHSGSVPVPFSPHRTTTAVNATTYTIGTYPTYYQGSTSVYRVTVIVSWAPAAVGGISNQVSSQTVITSPSSTGAGGGGCLSSQTHPFSAPCQPFLYAQATSGVGFVTITPQSGIIGNAISGPNGNAGVALTSAELSLDKADSTMQVEQVSTVQGAVRTSQASLNPTTGGISPIGGGSANAQADNDPATVSNQYSSATAAGLTAAATLSASGPGSNTNGITDTTNIGDTGTVVSTASAATTPSPPCTDLAGAVQTTGLPCGSASVGQQAGTSASANLVLFGGLNSLLPLGSIPLATVAAAPTATRVFTSRLVSPSASYCPATSGDGCVHAGAQRSIGTVTLAGLPSNLLGLVGVPALWGSSGNFLVQLSGYSDSVAAESGVGTSSSLPSATQTSSPTLTYWNGTTYTTLPVNWGANPPNLSIPSVTVNTTFNLQTVSVSITNTLVAGGTSTSTSGSSPCASGCAASARVASPISGDIFYTVTVGGQTVASLDISVDLGTLAVQTNYQAAPSAS